MAHVLQVVIEALWPTPVGSLRSTVIAWFDLNSEAGLGTWFAVIQLALAAAIAALIAADRRARRDSWIGWAALAIVLTIMSIDEQVLMHENLGRLGAAWGLTIGGQVLWFVPALIVVVVAAAAMLPFVVRLPVRTRRALMGAGALYLLGAVGFEALAWVCVVVIANDPSAALSPAIGMLQLGEETLEMLAVAVVITALLDYVATERSDARTAGDDRVDNRKE